MSFISNAFADTVTTAGAATAHASPQSTFMSFLPMIVIFVLFWFLLIRPQQKKTKLHNQMLASLGAGDDVVTSGGIMGKISKIDEQIVHLEIATNVVIKVQRSTIALKTSVVSTEKK